MAHSTVTPLTNLSRVNFPADPYGADHGRWVADTASAVGMYLGLAGNELWLCHRAGMFHDLGRRNPNWRERDDNHAVRSAELALHAVMADSDWKAMGENMLTRLAKVIAHHNLDGPPPKDPIGIALWDADSLDCVRLGPAGTPEIEQLIQKRYSRLISEMCRDREWQTKYIEKRRRSVTVGGRWAPGLVRR